MPPPPIDPVPPTGHTAGTAQTRDDLRALCPERVDGYDAALPAARAEVLARLLGALDRETLPGVTRRERRGDTLHVTLADGRDLRAPAAAAFPFAAPPGGLTAGLDGTAFDDPAALLRALPLGPHAARLAAEVDNSVANLALALADPPPATGPVLRGAAGDPDGLGRLEQLVLGGHPLHPCCRTRGGMSVADVLAYGPEHRPVIRLRRLRVPADRWYGDAPPVLYAHPWQARRLLERHPWLSDDGETGPVRPLMSLRTVAPLDGGEHVKTAVDVQMTSAVRTVSPAAVHNGPRLSALLERLTADLPLTVLRETAAGAVLVDGRPRRHLAHLRREAPRPGATETVVPLGALAAPSPRDGRPLLLEAVDDPYAWWHGLAHLLLPPLVTVLDRGVALEAHGQNTLLVLDAGVPVRILYRDLGGVRVSAARLARHGVEAPPVEGDLPSDDPAVLRTKLAAATLGTVCAQLIAVLAGAGADPARLWDSVAAAVASTGTADATHLLKDPLPVKAYTAMRLADDALDDVWTHVANPMAAP
ncbi:IucA/IucC family protein [Actinoplanes sp. NPDC026623]|uniref:IucA/IucC family protein n=1 Tax=Actinoplanes sp. NPDC026623 TaxID=3155610 RepID=UPI0033F53D8C